MHVAKPWMTSFPASGLEDIEALARRKGMLQGRKNDTETALQSVRDTLSELKGQKQMLESAGDAAANYRQQAESLRRD